MEIEMINRLVVAKATKKKYIVTKKLSESTYELKNIETGAKQILIQCSLDQGFFYFLNS